MDTSKSYQYIITDRCSARTKRSKSQIPYKFIQAGLNQVHLTKYTMLGQKSLALLYHLYFLLQIVESSEIARVENQIICPDSNPVHCYPKLFQPEDIWKVVREDQIIPPGLDVRMDFESGIKEAKLSENREVQKPKANHELVVANMDPGFRVSLEFMNGFVDGEFDQIKFSDVEDHLNELLEWSSDIESGIEIVKNVTPFLRLTGLLQNEPLHEEINFNKEQNESIKEKSFRILSLSFQNNLEAQKEFLNYLQQPTEFLKLLATKSRNENDMITRRKLGLLGTLISNGLFDQYFVRGGLEYKLIDLYSECKNDNIRERIMTILKSFTNYKREFDEMNDGIELNLDAEFANYVQEKLIQNSFNSEEVVEVMNSFAKVKKQSDNNNVVKLRSEFLDWLDKEINKAKALVTEKRDNNDNTKQEKERLENLVELRHGAFGNWLGTRRDLPDEL